MSPEHESLDKRIAKWLKEQGYPLEMTVARAFQGAGFHVVQSHYFEDSESGKMREIDIAVQRLSDIEQPVVMQVGAMIECKSTPGRPWLLFHSGVSERRFIPYDTTASRIAQELFLNICEEPAYKEHWSAIEDIPLFQPKNVGHGLTQAFTTGKDIPFEAVTTVIKATASRISSFDKLNNPGQWPLMCTIMFPMVVIDAKLFECYLGDSAEIHIKEIESGFVSQKGLTPDLVYDPIVHIITKPALNQIAELLNQTTSVLHRISSELMDLLIHVAATCIESNKERRPADE